MGPRLTKDACGRLRALVKGTIAAKRAKNVTELAARVGISPTSLYLFLRGGGMSEAVGGVLARACGVELVDLAERVAVTDAGQMMPPLVRKPRRELSREREPLPLHPSRFYVARLIEPFALLDYVPEGLEVEDILRAESAYRQARAIPPGHATRQWLAVHGKLNTRATEND